MIFTDDEDADMIMVKEWAAKLEALGVIAPMAVDIDGEPILDPDLKNGDIVYVPWAFPSLDKCVIEISNDNVVAKGTYGEYELKYGPNWYIVSGLDD
jgi:hypothetical protein